MGVYICGELIPLSLIVIGIIGLIYLGFAIWYAIVMSRLWRK